MASGHIETVVRRTCGGHGSGDLGLTDARLLERFVSQGDPQAFSAIVERHGPMVLGVCRHHLDDPQEAEDAFQATFLVLAHRASSIRKAHSLGYWLHGVARRIALKSNAHSARRRAHERQGVAMTIASIEDDTTWREVRPMLHEEVNRLPEKYRAPIVLCYLEGQTHEAAAAQLQWPVGTVKGRLNRARELLRSRLVRRGVALSVALLLALLNDEASAEVPSELAESTVEAALAVRAKATPVVPPRVSMLATLGMASLAGSKLTMAALSLVIIGAVSTSVAYVVQTFPTDPGLGGACHTGPVYPGVTAPPNGVSIPGAPVVRSRAEMEARLPGTSCQSQSEPSS